MTSGVWWFAAGKCMFASGLLPEPLTAFDDERAVDFGIGLCNIVNRTTRGSNNLSRCSSNNVASPPVQKCKQEAVLKATAVRSPE